MTQKPKLEGLKKVFYKTKPNLLTKKVAKNLIKEDWDPFTQKTTYRRGEETVYESVYSGVEWQVVLNWFGKALKESPLSIKRIYKNYKGEYGNRHFLPLRIYYGVNEFHGPDKLWILVGWDWDKDDIRHYAIKDFI